MAIPHALQVVIQLNIPPLSFSLRLLITALFLLRSDRPKIAQELRIDPQATLEFFEVEGRSR